MPADLLVEGTQEIVELETKELIDIRWQAGGMRAYKDGRAGDEGAPDEDLFKNL